MGAILCPGSAPAKPIPVGWKSAMEAAMPARSRDREGSSPRGASSPTNAHAIRVLDCDCSGNSHGNNRASLEKHRRSATSQEVCSAHSIAVEIVVDDQNDAPTKKLSNGSLLGQVDAGCPNGERRSRRRGHTPLESTPHEPNGCDSRDQEGQHSLATPSSRRRPSWQSSFHTSDVASGRSTSQVRRVSTHVCPDQLPPAAAVCTADMVDRMMTAEREKIKRKINSRAYENNFELAKLERQISSSQNSNVVQRLKRSMSTESSSAQQQVTKQPTFSSLEPNASASQTLPSIRRESDEQQLAHWYLGKVSAMKWLVTFASASIIAFLAAGIILSAHHVAAWKLHVVENLSQGSAAGHAYAFLFLLSYGLPCCITAALLVTYVAPHAGGSGIPEIKAYLNGVNMPQAFTFQAWASRSLGLFLVTSSGLFAGTEGPFAHLGGIVGSAFAENSPFISWWPLGGHRNRCEFISQGAAMGVAAAFGAPVGGILFSLEEASSFWSRSLTWRAFFGTMVAAMLAKFCKSGFRSISGPGFIEFPDKNAGFENWELGTFAALGLVTGLVGAAFCNSVKRTLRLRRRVFQLGSPSPTSKKMRLVEVLVVVLLTSCVYIWPAVAAGCTELPADQLDGHRQRRLMEVSDGPPDISGGLCMYGEYSTMGFILLSPKETSIKTLFSDDLASGAQFSIAGLLGSFIIVWTTTVVTFGSAMPVGLFIPNILAGACLGRVVGQELQELGMSAKPDVYALMGAAGALAGFSRMTISLVVIFLEITNNMYMLLPLMLVIMVSKQVADLFGPSVYDIVLDANPEVHLLDDALGEDHLLVLDGLTVHDVATTEVIVLRSFEPLDKVMQLLLQTSFSAYPVVDCEGRLVGVITRVKLLILVEQRAVNVGTGELIPVVSLADHAPEVTLCSTPVVRAYRHFRASGLQHLSVVDHQHVLLGLITRTDLAALCRPGEAGVEAVRAILHRKQAAAAAGLVVAHKAVPGHVSQGDEGCNGTESAASAKPDTNTDDADDSNDATVTSAQDVAGTPVSVRQNSLWQRAA